MIKTILTALLLSFNAYSMDIESLPKSSTINYLGMFSSRGFVNTQSFNCSMVRVMYKGVVRVLTAAHCCNGVYTEGVSMKKIDHNLDLCELSIKGVPNNGALISTIPPKLLDTVYTAGYLKTDGLFFGRGYVTAIGSTLVLTNAFSTPGMSGGPTFNQNGELVGINSRYLKARNQGIYVPSTKIIEFLDRK